MRILICIFLLGLNSVMIPFVETTSAQEESWKQVVLLRSTRADVERLLGKPIGKDYFVTYNLKDGVLRLEYYLFDHCKPSEGYRGDLNIPEWTVTEITFEPDDPPQLASLKLDLRNFRKVHESPNVPDMISYVNEQEGIDYTFEADGTTLHGIRYFPGKRFNNLRCAAR